MHKVLKSNWFWSFFATVLILFSFTIFSSWVVMVSVWFGLFFIFRFTKLESKLSDKEHKLYLATVLLYPVVETGIKWMIVKNVIPYSWFWLNRLEHFSWAIAVTILFLPTYTDIWKNLKWWQSMIFVVGLVCILGNFNEFFEYGLRMGNSKNFAAFYWDTIYDMMINMMGGLVGFVVTRWNAKIG